MQGFIKTLFFLPITAHQAYIDHLIVFSKKFSGRSSRQARPLCQIGGLSISALRICPHQGQKGFLTSPDRAASSEGRKISQPIFPDPQAFVYRCRRPLGGGGEQRRQRTSPQSTRPSNRVGKTCLLSEKAGHKGVLHFSNRCQKRTMVESCDFLADGPSRYSQIFVERLE